MHVLFLCAFVCVCLCVCVSVCLAGARGQNGCPEAVGELELQHEVVPPGGGVTGAVPGGARRRGLRRGRLILRLTAGGREREREREETARGGESERQTD